MAKSITITVKFTEDQLQDILNAANFSDKASLQVADLNRNQLAALNKDLQETSFADEIVEGSRQACANDWLSEWSPR